MIELPKYAKVKDRCCIYYFGPSDEYVLLLRLIKPLLERRFAGVEVCLGCRDDKADMLAGLPHVMLATEIKAKRDLYGHIEELKFNLPAHPIEELLDKYGISDRLVGAAEPADLAARCVIVTKGHHPTKNLEGHKIEALKRIAKDLGFYPEVDTDAANAGLVMGVESCGLFAAAARGVRTKLVPTGVGTRLYRNLFLNNEVLHI
jgi:hypothetical protein